MDFSTLLKFFHITVATLWVGGGFTLILAGLARAQSASAEDQLAHIRTLAFLGPRFFIPVSMATLGSGVALLFSAGWGWQPFTVLGLAGVLLTSMFGALVLGPSCEKATRIAETRGAVAALPMVRRTYRLALLDYAVQFAIVFLMVVKPGWQDFAVFGGLAGILLLAALAASRPTPRLA